MKKRFAASAMILAMSAATVLSPLTTFAETEEQELNIAIFQGGYGDAYWNQMVELFEASHEGVKVNMTISPTIGDIIRPQIVAGNAPDFICLNDGGEDGVILSLIKEHALLNLDDVFDGAFPHFYLVNIITILTKMQFLQPVLHFSLWTAFGF